MERIPFPVRLRDRCAPEKLDCLLRSMVGRVIATTLDPPGEARATRA